MLQILSFSFYKVACIKPCLNPWAWKRSKITVNLVTFWAMLNKQYVTASKFRKGTKSSSCMWFLGCFKPICALLTRIRVDRNDCCIYEGYATRNIENIEQCNHSLFCLNMPPFLPMLWAVATEASISGIKMSFWILLWNRYMHGIHCFLFVCFL